MRHGMKASVVVLLACGCGKADRSSPDWTPSNEQQCKERLVDLMLICGKADRRDVLVRRVDELTAELNAEHVKFSPHEAHAYTCGDPRWYLDIDDCLTQSNEARTIRGQLDRYWVKKVSSTTTGAHGDKSSRANPTAPGSGAQTRTAGLTIDAGSVAPPGRHQKTCWELGTAFCERLHRYAEKSGEAGKAQAVRDACDGEMNRGCPLNAARFIEPSDGIVCDTTFQPNRCLDSFAQMSSYDGDSLTYDPLHGAAGVAMHKADPQPGRATDALVRITASTTHPPGAGYTFIPENLGDADLKTCWQASSGDRAPWFKVEFDADRTITAVKIANGFQTADRHGDEFLLNSRIATARLRFSDNSEVPVAFENDARGFTKFEIAPTRTRFVTVIVDSTHKGTRWSDLAVSEIKFETP